MSNRPSSVDRLEPEIREEIGRLRGAGHTIDEILAALRELDVAEISRSALGRHVKGLDAVGRQLRHSRTVTEALVRQLGHEPASRSAALNIELLHTAILDLFLNAEAENTDAKGKAALAGNPGGIMQLAKALESLTSSASSDAENRRKIRDEIEKQVKKETEARLSDAMKERGLSPDTADKIRKKVLGLK
ncbi:DUF3486 family protein [Acetobacter sp. DsW_063]|uniref:DUF3486 family protein n=1 Tax=Acetobacter sp. DsW_063 TaxID=1514894 RepID=UPI000A36F069|nr:DUF3486 family protein [Acetobacter sp. DsW_063]OUJ17069.1 hypothetical protein HK28_07830 [Acetobacter sp. DsW_063]